MITVKVAQSVYSAIADDDDDVEVCVEVLTGMLESGVNFEFSIEAIDNSSFGM